MTRTKKKKKKKVKKLRQDRSSVHSQDTSMGDDADYPSYYETV